MKAAASAFLLLFSTMYCSLLSPPPNTQTSSDTSQGESCWAFGDKSALLVHLIIHQIFTKD